MSWTDTFASSFPPWVRDRGASYFARGRVRLEEVTPETAKATVGGSRPYHVRITRRTADVGVSCTCPAFGTEPCKHVWATLVALDQREDGRQMGGFLLDVDDAVRDPKSPEVPRSSPFLPASVARGARSERRQEPS